MKNSKILHAVAFCFIFFSCEKDKTELDSSILLGQYSGYAVPSLIDRKIDVNLTLSNLKIDFIEFSIEYTLTNSRITYDSLVVQNKIDSILISKNSADYVINGTYYKNDSLKITYKENGLEINYFTKKK